MSLITEVLSDESATNRTPTCSPAFFRNVWDVLDEFVRNLEHSYHLADQIQCVVKAIRAGIRATHQSGTRGARLPFVGGDRNERCDRGESESTSHMRDRRGIAGGSARFELNELTTGCGDVGPQGVADGDGETSGGQAGGE